MADFSFNQEQLDAIYSTGENLLVSAGAGSGKTTVLVRHVIERITAKNHPTCLQQMLILTFTNAAAQDMRLKIDQALNSMLCERGNDPHLLHELALLPQADIGTIHSFCLDLLRRYYYLLDLDAGFRVADPREIDVLYDEVITELLEDSYALPHHPVHALADAYGGKNGDEGLQKMILALYEFSRSQPYPLAWLNQCVADFSAECLSDYPWAPLLRDALTAQVKHASAIMAKAKLLADDPRISDKWRIAIADEYGELSAIASINDLAGVIDSLHVFSFSNLRRPKDTESADLYEAISSERKEARELINSLRKRFACQQSEDFFVELQNLSPLMNGLVELVRDFSRRLDAKKQRKKLIDFSDMEHKVLELLRHEDIASELREHYVEIYIDEYQDINAVQDEILCLLTRGDNLFAVGDVKQSIYRFRLAEPRMFLGKYSSYGLRDGGRRIDLNCNYRSSRSIIAGVNLIFREIMRADTAEIDYDESAELKPGSEITGVLPELYFIDLRAKDNDVSADDEEEDQDAIQAEARFIAKRAQELIAEGYQPKDMAVLLRSPKGRDLAIIDELSAVGIRAVAEKKDNILLKPEIRILIAVLQAVDNPLRDLPLGTVMRSPLFPFDENELLQIHLDHVDEPLYTAVVSLAQGADALAKKCAELAESLAAWRDCAAYRGVSALVDLILHDTGYFYLCGALPGGDLRQDNLLRFQEITRDYERQNYAGLFRFVQFLEDTQERGWELGANLAANDDAVHVMSIHHSKGLEYPVVFVAGLGSRFHHPADGSQVIWHKDLGLGPRIGDRESRTIRSSLAYEAILMRLHQESIAEEIRILYVAMTRAKERLILAAALRDFQRSRERWLATSVDDTLFLNDRRAIDWLARTLVLHPDGAAINGAEPPDDPRFWIVQVVAPVAAIQKETSVESGVVMDDQSSNERQQAKIERLLTWAYPHGDACSSPAKWTVSQVREQEGSARLFSYVADDSATEFAPDTALRRGNINHFLLQHLDWRKVDQGGDLSSQIEELIHFAGFSEEEKDLISYDAIEGFCMSELGKRAAASCLVVRERPFTYAVPAADFPPAVGDSDDYIILQGAPDLVFAEDDGWVLVDYKTGGRGKTEEQLLENYGAQLYWYCRAVGDLSGRKVKEAYLYMLDDGRIIRYDEEISR